MKNTALSKIEWWVPLEWHMRQAKRELRTVFVPGVFTRIILASLTVAVPLCYLAEKMFGPLDVDWVRMVGGALVFGLAVMLIGAALCFIPPKISVSDTGVSVLNGQHSFFVPFDKMQAVSVRRTVVPTLFFSKGKRDHEYAIGPTVDVEALISRLSSQSSKFMVL